MASEVWAPLWDLPKFARCRELGSVHGQLNSYEQERKECVLGQGAAYLHDLPWSSSIPVSLLEWHFSKVVAVRLLARGISPRSRHWLDSLLNIVNRVHIATERTMGIRRAAVSVKRQSEGYFFSVPSSVRYFGAGCKIYVAGKIDKVSLRSGFGPHHGGD